MQWRRGIRAGIAVACLMVTLHLLGRPTRWAAFGVLLVLNVDNGGPYTVSAVLIERNGKSKPFANPTPLISPHPSLAQQQMIRIEHQVNVLERTAADIAANT